MPALVTRIEIHAKGSEGGDRQVLPFPFLFSRSRSCSSVPVPVLLFLFLFFCSEGSKGVDSIREYGELGGG